MDADDESSLTAGNTEDELEHDEYAGTCGPISGFDWDGTNL